MKKSLILLLTAGFLGTASAQNVWTPVTTQVTNLPGIGIGTSAPAADLDIVNGTAANIRLFRNAAQNMTISQGTDQRITGTNDFYLNSAYALTLASSTNPLSTNDGIIFRTSNVVRMCLYDNTGNLWLGTGFNTPITRFHTDGFITSDELAWGANPVPPFTTFHGLVVANSIGTLENRIDFTNDPTDYLAGDGTWQKIPSGGGGGGTGGGSDLDWYHNTLTGDISTGYINGSYADGNVSIGQAPTGNGKLEVITFDPTGPAAAITSSIASVPGSTSIEAYNSSGGTGVTNTAIKGVVQGGDFAVGGDYYVNASSTINFGVGVRSDVSGAQFESTGADFSADGQNTSNNAYGVKAEAINTSVDAIGGRFDAAFGQNNNYGVFAKASFGTNAYGVWAEASSASSDNYAFYSNGESFSTFSGSWTTSDRKLKKNIQELEDISEVLNQVNIYSYEFRNDEYPSINLSERTNYGVISQELESILPDLVKDVKHPARYDSEGNIEHSEIAIKSVNYELFIPLLIKAHQEQNNEIEDLRSEIAQLKYEATIAPSISNQSNSTAVGGPSVLMQNHPNPFGQSTTIRFDISETAMESRIMIIDANGVVRMEYDNLPSGSGQVKVQADTLTPGIYAYVLLVDGLQVDSKQMIVMK